MFQPFHLPLSIHFLAAFYFQVDYCHPIHNGLRSKDFLESQYLCDNDASAGLGNSKHYIFRRPICFSHLLCDAALTPLASVFWHMVLLALASDNLCSFGVASVFKIAWPFRYHSHICPV